MIETKAWKRTLPAEPVRYFGAYKWGGYWHTICRRFTKTPRLFKTPEAARKAAAKAAPSIAKPPIDATAVAIAGAALCNLAGIAWSVSLFLV